MNQLAVIHHSAHGHTEHIATQVAEGARGDPNAEVHLLTADALAQRPDDLLADDGFILGSPTDLGAVSSRFKRFMDGTGRLRGAPGGSRAGWRLKGRLAAGFTVSSLPSGDKQSTLMSMFVFSMQHGMLWFGNPVLPEQRAGVPGHEAANRLGSWSGLMSLLMSLLVSGLATLRTAGLSPAFAAQWCAAWLTTWPVAFPVVLLAAPLARRVVERLTAPV